MLNPVWFEGYPIPRREVGCDPHVCLRRGRRRNRSGMNMRLAEAVVGRQQVGVTEGTRNPVMTGNGGGGGGRELCV